MPLKPCRECQKEVAATALKCPNCGVANPTATPAVRAITGALTLVLFGAIIWFFYGGGLQSKVASDFTDQYNIAKASGTAMDQCVHAGLVSAAYLQAEDHANYDKWKAIENSDCSTAGLPR